MMSYEGLCLAIHDNPAAGPAMSDRIGRLMEDYYRHLLSLDRVICLFPGDDMGFRTATLWLPSTCGSMGWLPGINTLPGWLTSGVSHIFYTLAVTWKGSW